MKQIIKCCTVCCVLVLASLLAHAQPNLVRVEYYLDSDPGYGKGTAVSFSPGTSLSNIGININPATLSYGVHTFGIRAQEANGTWSQDNLLVFARPYPSDTTKPAPVPNLARVEYYLDNDPGYGNGTAVSFSPGNSLSNTGININPATLSYGVHTFGIRAKDANGGWSQDNKLVFARPYPSDSTSPAPVPNLARVEYYLDNDPGYGKGTAVSFSPGTSLFGIGVNINPDSLSSGVHVFGIRAQDANGGWSQDNLWLFAKPYPADTTKPAPAPNLARVEYYFDKDPGYGKGVPVAINKVTGLPNFNMPVNIAGLKAGSHKLFIRSQDANGGWSLDNNYAFKVSTAVTGHAIVVNSVTRKTLCAKDNFQLAYNADTTYNAGNVFTAQLSDSTGNFGSPTVIGSYTGTGNTIINCSLPANLSSGSLYRVRVVSSDPAVTGITGSDTLSIHSAPFKPTITGDSSVNIASSYTYSVPFVAGYTWTWIAPAATITPTADSASLLWDSAGAQTVKLVQANQYGCASDTAVDHVSVYALRIDTVKISTTRPCPGSNVTVTADASGVYNAGNTFKAQLSDSSGSFANAVTIGTLTASPTGSFQPISISSTLPSNLPGGNAYRIRVVSTSPAATGIDTLQHIFISSTATPAAITGKSYNLCGMNGILYTADTVAGATSYTWKVPGICTLVSGQGTDSITVNVPSGFTSNYITVKAVNGCGSSGLDSLRIFGKPTTPSQISGPTSVNAKQAGLVYNTPTIPGVTYTWSVPSGATITAGQGTRSITVTWGTIAGSVKVYDQNSCGVSNTKSLSVTVKSSMAAESDALYTEPEATGLQLFPNPTISTATLVFSVSSAGKYNVEITDVAGRKLRQIKGIANTGENRVQLDVSAFAGGIYMVRLTDDEHGQRITRLLKQ